MALIVKGSGTITDSGLARRDRGLLWDWFPADGLNHDPYGYLRSERSATNLGSAPVKAAAQR